jgi:tetratricopeptide (TPR) repeat protein
VGYRDLNQQEQALAAVDRALQETPNNPDLLYLKAQILTRQSNHQASLRFYRRALAQQNQLPRSLVIQISFEECRTQNRVNRRQRNCDAERDAQREQASRPVRAGRSS